MNTNYNYILWIQSDTAVEVLIDSIAIRIVIDSGADINLQDKTVDEVAKWRPETVLKQMTMKPKVHGNIPITLKRGIFGNSIKQVSKNCRWNTGRKQPDMCQQSSRKENMNAENTKEIITKLCLILFSQLLVVYCKVMLLNG